MKGRSIMFLIVSIVLMNSSCHDIIEEDLSNDRVELLNPTDNLTTTYSTQTYMWSKVEGADSYQIQIVSGSFNQINYFALDSTVLGNQFVYNLNPGIYQWRVKAKNSVSETHYVVRSIIIDSTKNLTGQSILLLSPKENYFSKDSLIGFSWLELYNADEYIIQIRENTLNGALIFSDTTSLSDIPKGQWKFSEGSFSWSIKASNSISSTGFSNRQFTTDYTSPAKPTIPSSVDSIQNKNFSLSWIQNSNDIDFDSLYIYGNSNLTDIKKRILTRTSSYSDSLNSGIYFWKVKSIDYAKNQSQFTLAKRLEIQ